MAKDKKNKNGHDAGQDGGHDAVATALTAPDAPAETVVGTAPVSAHASVVPPTAPPARPAAPAPARPAAGPPRSLADDAVSAVSDVGRVVRTVLPNRLPAYLGGAALLVLGVVDLPAVAGGALAYEAIRRWRPVR
ncbi:hypothetical protein ACQPX6_23240 [Actinomycetospora sp. CA-101289]|uniref:hypothetical protein n=1 Tax=Actinomycetospora sp. CA-101289 TaxID=3239893 RepID=UPI003D98D57D